MAKKKAYSFKKLIGSKKGIETLFNSKPVNQQTSKTVKQPGPVIAPELIKVTFYIEPEVSKKLGILAIEKNSNKSALANEALRILLKKNGKTV